MIKVLGADGVTWTQILMNAIMKDASMAEEWRKGALIPLYVQKERGYKRV